MRLRFIRSDRQTTGSNSRRLDRDLGDWVVWNYRKIGVLFPLLFVFVVCDVNVIFFSSCRPPSRMSMRTPVPGDGDRTEDEHIDYIAEGIVEVRDWRFRVIDFSFPYHW